MGILLIVFVVLEAIDAVMTVWAMRQGGFTELNPLIAPIATQWWMPAVKILPAIVAAIIIWKLVARWPRLQGIATGGAILACCFIGLVVITNFIEIGRK
jgi:hypothetical protein